MTESGLRQWPSRLGAYQPKTPKTPKRRFFLNHVLNEDTVANDKMVSRRTDRYKKYWGPTSPLHDEQPSLQSEKAIHKLFFGKKHSWAKCWSCRHGRVVSRPPFSLRTLRTLGILSCDLRSRRASAWLSSLSSSAAAASSSFSFPNVFWLVGLGAVRVQSCPEDVVRKSPKTEEVA